MCQAKAFHFIIFYLHRIEIDTESGISGSSLVTVACELSGFVFFMIVRVYSQTDYIEIETNVAANLIAKLILTSHNRTRYC